MTGDVVWTSASFDGSGNVTGTATIQANSVALGTDTTGDYVSTITGGTGITSTGATSGEGIAHSLSVDASQTQITGVGTITTGTWNANTIAANKGGNYFYILYKRRYISSNWNYYFRKITCRNRSSCLYC